MQSGWRHRGAMAVNKVYIDEFAPHMPLYHRGSPLRSPVFFDIPIRPETPIPKWETPTSRCLLRWTRLISRSCRSVAEHTGFSGALNRPNLNPFLPICAETTCPAARAKFSVVISVAYADVRPARRAGILKRLGIFQIAILYQAAPGCAKTAWIVPVCYGLHVICWTGDRVRTGIVLLLSAHVSI